ncbi:MAG: hypothetical protein AB7P00_10135, partial [Sandaracinaceae bacterium]
SGVRCPYPTATPDFFVGARVLWSDDGSITAGTEIASHGYRGGPFVIEAADAEAARAIIDAWNDQSAWAANPWAQRTVFNVVSVHEATAGFSGFVRRQMIEAPTIAVFSDGNEDIATRYLRAAGIPQSNGMEFPAGRCGAADCGPGTSNPDMLTVPSIMGDMGTCDAPNTDHHNGALFNADGTPAYCQIMSMHWGVDDRERVECDGGGCPATLAECAGETFTFHGHEVVAEVREFLAFPTHFFAECQAVNAYENTVPNPEWPYLDDAGRNGHFLTTTGMPPACPCMSTETAFECVAGACGGSDCCLPRDVKEQGAGFLIAQRPDAASLQILNPQIAYNQLDGAFETVGGSEPAYNLSEYLGTAYINDLSVTFITGPDGPGDQDLWMTGFLDGECDIVTYDEFAEPGECARGKVSYLGGHQYSTALPVSSHADTQGTRLFLNSLFEADCVTGGLTPPPPDTDGDGVLDDDDPFPTDPRRCGDSDMDSCDDCTNGPFNPANDCPLVGDDAGVSPGMDAGPGGAMESGCGCRAAGRGERTIPSVLLIAIACALGLRGTRARRRAARRGSARATRSRRATLGPPWPRSRSRPRLGPRSPTTRSRR